MTISEANTIVRNYYRISNPNEEQDFAFTEAMGFIIEKTKNPGEMMQLGGWYYERKNFDLALKYYEMAAACNYEEAYGCLGYIWLYGRTGEKDYKKAFEYYTLSAQCGNLESEYKIADMYKNGYYVEQDYEKYKSMIEKLYKKVKRANDLYAPVPQIFIRLAKIRAEDGLYQDAANLLLYAKSFLSQRLRINPFFGDISNMKWLISELYNVTKFDTKNFDFYDTFYLLTTPHRITFRYLNQEHSLESVEENGECVINFDGNWYRKPTDFFGRATINNKKLTAIYDDLYGFEVK